jgi:hypothetical protein
METDPVSETSCFLVSKIPEAGKSKKKINSKCINIGGGYVEK